MKWLQARKSVYCILCILLMSGFSANASGRKMNRLNQWRNPDLSKTKAPAVQNSYFEQWHELNHRWEKVSDEEPDFPVTAMTMHQGQLHIGGYFSHIGDKSFSNVARFNGETWHSLGHGLGDPDMEVVNMVSFGGDLYVVTFDFWADFWGFFKWDGQNWIDLSGTTNGAVYTVYAYGGNLYIGGFFTQAGGVPANYIAVGDGTNWAPLDGGVTGAVWEIVMMPDTHVGNMLFAYHEHPDLITTVPEPTHISIFQPGGFWQVFVDDLEFFLWDMKAYGERLWVGGELHSIHDDPFHAIAYSDGGEFRQAAFSGLWAGEVYSIHHNGRSLFAGGLMLFSHLDCLCSGIARKYGDAWEPLGFGLYWEGGPGLAYSNLLQRGEYLYVGGWFDRAGGKPINNLARYRMTVDYPYASPGHTVTGGIYSSPSLGCAWGDYDGDGDEDLFVANDWGKANFLFRNNGDGTFKKVKDHALVDHGCSSAAGCWGDVDNDGNLDLFVVNRNGENNQLFINGGDGSFKGLVNSPVVQDGSAGNAAAWADYDNDGWIDLFVANKNGQNNLLYHNNGDGTFTQVAEGDIVNDGGNSRGCAWGDYDNDGFVDLFVANNRQENNFLYQNNGDGTFNKVTAGDVVNDAGGSWSGSWGDYDADGDLDLFVANDGEPNFLYQNNGGSLERFRSREVTAGNHACRSAAWGDCDKDGDLDLFVSVRNDESHLYVNQGDGQFIRYLIPADDDNRGAAWGDFDNDGDLDLMLVNNGRTNCLMTHQDNANHYVKIQLKGTRSNVCGIGARIFVTASIKGNTRTQMQEINAQSGTGGQNSLIATFGLGDASTVEKIRVEWPSGVVQEVEQVNVDQRILIEESETDVILPVSDEVNDEGQNEIVNPTDIAQISGLPETFKLYQNHPNPFNPETRIGYDVAKSGGVQVVVFDLSGKTIATLVDQTQSAGHYEICWSGIDDRGSQMPSGVYVLRFVSGTVVQTRKMVLMR